MLRLVAGDRTVLPDPLRPERVAGQRGEREGVQRHFIGRKDFLWERLPAAIIAARCRSHRKDLTYLEGINTATLSMRKR